MKVGAGPFKLHLSRVSHNGRAPASSTMEPDRATMRELGTAGRGLYYDMSRTEYVPELKGKRWIKVVDQMHRSDSQVRSAHLLIKTPVLSAQWYVEPYTNSPEDKEVAEFVEWCLHNMHNPLLWFLKEALLCLKYNNYVFEKCFEPARWRPKREGAHERPVTKWEKFAPRHPITHVEWKRNDNGEVTTLIHRRTSEKATEDVPIPRDKLLLYAWDAEADEPEGISIDRSAYIHWYFKHNLYKVDAIQKERHGIGIPRVKLLPGFQPDDKKIANELGKNLRTNEKAHITQLPSFEVDFVEMKGQPVDALESAIHHGGQILGNVLAQFTQNTTAEGDKRTGSQIGVFDRALRYLADFIRMEVNQRAIPELVDYNFEVKGYPILRVRRLTENAEWRTISVALRNLTEPGIITPTPELEEWVLDQMDFPPPSDAALKRSIKDRLLKGKPPDQGGNGNAANQNRDDQGNAEEGKSPSGNPTE